MLPILKVIKNRRLELGLKQHDLTPLVGMSRQQYQRLESKGNPRLNTLEQIAAGLKCTLLLIPEEKLQAVLEVMNTDTSSPEAIVVKTVTKVAVVAEPKPVISEPVATEPVVSEPDTVEPVVAKPAISEPDAVESVVAKPVTSEPVATEPVVLEEPVISEPIAAEPVVEQLSEQAVIEVKKARKPAKKKKQPEPEEAPMQGSLF